MANYNPGFAFYENYWRSIENLPIEQQKEICYAVVKYGITYEMVDSKEMPLGFSFTQGWHEAIENSVDRWVLNQNKANFKVDENMSRDMLIAKLIVEGNNSNQIAEKITEITGKEIGASTIRKSVPWKERNDENFTVKWLGNERENSQIGTRECDGNVRDFSQKECENSQKITQLEQSNVKNIMDMF